MDELKIKYQPADRTLETFLETYKDKAIIIDVSENFEDIDAQLLKGLYKKYKYIKIAFNFNRDFLLRAQKYEIPYFFTDYVTSIDKLIGLMEYLPTDMYICEELGFFLPKVSKILHDNGIRVRVFPNICQSSFSETPSLKTFFIRPEDIFFYAQYVDILRNACQGAGTNEEDIIKVIAATNNQERAMIRRLYNQKYNEDLVARLQSELSGDFREAALGSFMTPTEYDAYCLNSALKGKNSSRITSY